jgi:hypothetical protein
VDGKPPCGISQGNLISVKSSGSISWPVGNATGSWFFNDAFPICVGTLFEEDWFSLCGPEPERTLLCSWLLTRVGRLGRVSGVALEVLLRN